MKDAPIRILIADDSTVMRHALAQIIEAQPDMEVADLAATGHEAVRRVLELQPDIVLMDVHMPDMDGIQATWLLSNKSPHGAVIMVSSEERPEFVRRAMTAGAQGYVLKPFGDGAQLLQTIREISGRTRMLQIEPAEPAPDAPPVPMKAGKRIVIFGSKGGIGKTSLAVNLALWLHQSTKTSVAIFDADLVFGDVNIHLDLPPERTVIDLLPRIETLDSYLLNLVMGKHASGIHVLARPPRPEQVDVINDGHVRAILGMLATTYDYVITDTSPSYDERMLAALDMADVYILVFSPELGILRDTRHFLDVAHALNYPEDRMCFVLNRANSLAGLTMEDVTSILGTRRVFQIPSVGSSLAQSINQGRPMMVTQAKSAYSRAVAAVAEHARLLTTQTAVR